REPTASRAKYLEDLGQRARTRVEPRAQRLALDELHDDEGPGLGLADFVDADDVGVGQPSHGLGLADQASVEMVFVVELEQRLDRDLAIEVAIVGLVDATHGAS